jgi:ankyrin repeat protein
VEFTSPTGSTPLMKAIGSRNLECVKVLIEAKANLDSVTQGGISAYKIAETINHVDILDLLNSYKGG